MRHVKDEILTQDDLIAIKEDFDFDSNKEAVKGVEQFDKTKPKKAETVVKNPLPTAEDLEAARAGDSK